jgi:hypothetical protein
MHGATIKVHVFLFQRNEKKLHVLQVNLEKLLPSYTQVYFQLIVLHHTYGQILHVSAVSGGYLQGVHVTKRSYINKALIILPNTTYTSNTTVFYYTLQHVSVQVSHHQVISDTHYNSHLTLYAVYYVVYIHIKSK